MATHFRVPGHAVGLVLVASHVMMQNELVVATAHVTAGSVGSPQSAVVVHGSVHAYVVMAPPPKENFSQTNDVPVHAIPDDEQAVAKGEADALPSAASEDMTSDTETSAAPPSRMPDSLEPLPSATASGLAESDDECASGVARGASV